MIFRLINYRLTNLMNYNVYFILVPILVTSGIISVINAFMSIKSNVSISEWEILNGNLLLALLAGILTPIIYSLSFYIFYVIWFKLITFEIKIVDLLKVSLLGFLPSIIISIANLILNIIFGYRIESYTMTLTNFGGIDSLNLLGFLLGYYILYIKFNMPKSVVYWGVGLYSIFILVISKIV